MTGREQEERVRHLMMAALDGELGGPETAELERLLAEDDKLRGEWQRMRQVKDITEAMGYREPPEEVWDTYWTSVFRRFERGLGWVLASAGALVLAGWAVWHAVQAILADSGLPGFVKVATFSLAMGLIVLAVSVLREKVFTRRSDVYREVRR